MGIIKFSAGYERIVQRKSRILKKNLQKLKSRCQQRPIGNMAGNKHNGDSNHHIPPGRVERLLRERELRKSRIRGIQSSNNNQMGDVYLEQDQHKDDVASSSIVVT